MRIIAGSLKNRRFKMPKHIRPTQDKVRKALFDILSGEIESAQFLDLFAGSGSVAFEAISRGAENVVLAEDNPACLKAINENLKSLSPEESRGKAQVLAINAFGAIDFLSRKGRKFEIIFADPPYYEGLANKVLKKLTDCDILDDNGLLVLQHHKKDLFPKEAGFFRLLRQEKYGDTILSFFRK